jgi:hypothetical protein
VARFAPSVRVLGRGDDEAGLCGGESSVHKKSGDCLDVTFAPWEDQLAHGGSKCRLNMYEEDGEREVQVHGLIAWSRR